MSQVTYSLNDRIRMEISSFNGLRFTTADLSRRGFNNKISNRLGELEEAGELRRISADELGQVERIGRSTITWQATDKLKEPVPIEVVEKQREARRTKDLHGMREVWPALFRDPRLPGRVVAKFVNGERVV